MTRNVLQPIEPVEPSMAIPFGFVFALIFKLLTSGQTCETRRGSADRLSHPPRFGRRPRLHATGVRCGKAVRPSRSLFPFTNDFDVQLGSAIAVTDVDIAGNDLAKILNFADVLF